MKICSTSKIWLNKEISCLEFDSDLLISLEKQELALIHQISLPIRVFESNINVVILGVGSGEKELSFIVNLKKNNRLQRISVLDVNPVFLKQFSSTCHFNVPEFTLFQQFIETADKTINPADGQTVFLLLGNTIGNFDSMDSIINKLHYVMKPDDIVVVGYHINSGKLEEFSPAYETEFISRLINSNASKILRWKADYRNSMIYTISDDKRIISRKFDKGMLPFFFQRFGFILYESLHSEGVALEVFQKPALKDTRFLSPMPKCKAGKACSFC